MSHLLLPLADRDPKTCKGEGRSFLQLIDMNRLPSGIDFEEELVVSSPNNTISSVSGKRRKIGLNAKDHDVDTDCSSGNSDEEVLILLNT